jgi:thiol-disulfide isomerase/thioredoxin
VPQSVRHFFCYNECTRMKFKPVPLVLILLFTLMAKNASAQKLNAVSPDSVLSIINHLPDSGTIVINFWATWCGPCVSELPYFHKADSILHGENVTFVFVSFDPPSKAGAVQNYITKKKIPGTHYLINSADLDQFIGKVEKNWAGNIPYTIILTAEDRKNHEGSFESFKDLWNFIRTDS